MMILQTFWNGKHSFSFFTNDWASPTRISNIQSLDVHNAAPAAADGDLVGASVADDGDCVPHVTPNGLLLWPSLVVTMTFHCQNLRPPRERTRLWDDSLPASCQKTRLFHRLSLEAKQLTMVDANSNRGSVRTECICAELVQQKSTYNTGL